jgi:hypothetical protein
MPSHLASKKFLAWMQFCKEIGWPKSDMNMLADLWWKHHDHETGELV